VNCDRLNVVRRRGPRRGSQSIPPRGKCILFLQRNDTPVMPIVEKKGFGKGTSEPSARPQKIVGGPRGTQKKVEGEPLAQGFSGGKEGTATVTERGFREGETIRPSKRKGNRGEEGTRRIHVPIRKVFLQEKKKSFLGAKERRKRRASIAKGQQGKRKSKLGSVLTPTRGGAGHTLEKRNANRRGGTPPFFQGGHNRKRSWLLVLPCFVSLSGKVLFKPHKLWKEDRRNGIERGKKSPIERSPQVKGSARKRSGGRQELHKEKRTASQNSSRRQRGIVDRRIRGVQKSPRGSALKKTFN